MALGIEDAIMSETFSKEIIFPTSDGDIHIYSFCRPEQIEQYRFNRHFGIFDDFKSLFTQRESLTKSAARENANVVLAVEGTKDIIGMDQTADSMEKNRILDALFSITQSRQEKDDGRINLWVAKNRNGKSGQSLEFTINYRNMQIKEVNLSNMTGTSEDE